MFCRHLVNEKEKIKKELGMIHNIKYTSLWMSLVDSLNKCKSQFAKCPLALRKIVANTHIKIVIQLCKLWS